jgi:hypothetical protein
MSGTGKKRSEKRKRTIPLAGRFTPDEAVLVRTKAKEYGGSVSNFIRQRTIDAPPPRHAAEREILAKLLTEIQRHRAELGKQGSNLNQLTHYANMDRVLAASIADATEEVKRGVATLDELRLATLQAMGSEPKRKPPRA